MGGGGLGPDESLALFRAIFAVQQPTALFRAVSESLALFKANILSVALFQANSKIKFWPSFGEKSILRP